MSDRIVRWRALADFTKVRKEARETEKALKDLQGTSSSVADTTEKDSKRVTDAQSAGLRTQMAVVAAARDRVKAEKEIQTSVTATATVEERSSEELKRSYAAKMKALREAREEQRRTSNETEASSRREATAAGRVINQIGRLETARRESVKVTDAERAAQTKAMIAKQQERLAALSLAEASRQLTTARERSAAAARDSKASEDARARSLAAVARAEINAERATARHAIARQKLAAAERAASASTRAEAHSRSRSGSGGGGGGGRGGGGGDGGARAYRAASAGWARAQRAAGEFSDFLLMRLPVILSLVGMLAGAVGALGGGFMALAGAMAPSVGILATLPGLLMAAVGSIMTVVAAFGSIGEAMGAHGKMQENAGKEAAAAAKTQASAAKQVESAQRGLSRAQRDAARSERDAVRSVIRARRDAAEAARESAEAVAEAQEEQARTAEDGARRMADAQENAHRRLRAAAEATADAEQRLRRAQGEAKFAQDALTGARKDAIRELDQLKDAVRDASLAEEGAVLSVEEARIRLEKLKRDPRADDLELRRAELALREAKARLSDAREAKQEAIENDNEVSKKGIEGTRAWQDAQERIAQTQEDVAEAINSLSKARRDEAETERDVAKELADVARSVAEANENAADRVADAMESQRKSAVASAEAIAQAEEQLARTREQNAESIADAQRMLNDALAAQSDAFASGSASTDAFNDAMAKLSPTARELVWLLIDIKEKWKEVQAVASEAMFPGVIDGLNSLMKLFPMVLGLVENLGRTIGDNFRDLGKMLTTPRALADWQTSFDSTNVVAGDLGRTFNNLAQMILRVMAEAAPLTEWLTGNLADWAETRNELSLVNQESGKTAEWFGKVRRSLSLLGEILGNIGGGFGAMALAGEESGFRLLESIESVTGGFEDHAKSVEGQDQLKQYFEDAEPAIYAIGNFIREITKMLLRMGTDENLAPLIDSLTYEVLPRIEELFSILSEKGIGEALVDTINAFLDALIQAAESGAMDGIVLFLEGLVSMFDILGDVAEIPGVAATISGIAAALMSFKAVKMVGAVTGVTSMFNALKDGVGWYNKNRKGVDGFLAAGGGGGKGGGGAIIAPPPTGKPVKGMAPPPGQPKPGNKGVRTMSGGAAGAAAGVGALLMLIPFEGVLGTISTIVGALLLALPLLIPIFTGIAAAVAAAAAAIGIATLPMWLIIGAVVAIGAALVLLWQKNETFRNFIIGAWNSIKDAVVGVWNNYIWPALSAFGNFITDTLWPAIQNFWTTVIKPVFGAIGSFIAQTWTNIIWPALNAFWSFITGTLATVISWLWNDIMVPAWKGISDVISTVWNNVIWPTLEAFWAFISGVLVPIIQLLWNDVIAPIFGFIGNLIKNTWENIISPALSAFWSFIKDTLAPAISGFWNDTVSPIFGWIGGTISSVWNDTIKPALEKFGEAMGNLKKAFEGAKEGIGEAWENIKKIVSEPIAAVINWIGDKFIDNINAMLDKVGIGWDVPWPKHIYSFSGGGTFDRRSTAMASGGVLPGYSPGRDDMHWEGPYGRLSLAGGEAIMRPEWTRALGKRRVDEMNAKARSGGVQGVRKMLGFSRGGIMSYRNGGTLEHSIPLANGEERKSFSGAGGSSSSIDFSPESTADKILGAIGNVVDVRKHIGNAIEALITPIWNQVPGAIKLPAEVMIGATKKMVSSFGSKVNEEVGSTSVGGSFGAPPGAGGGGPGGNMGWRAQWNLVKSRFPSAILTSSKRPGGTRTASGFISYHSRGRAIDVAGPAMKPIYNWLTNKFGKQSPEIYFGPGGWAQRYGRKHYLKGITALTHPFNHVHWANARGGVLPQEFNRGGTVGGTGRGDKVPAMLEPGEFVMRRKAVSKLGLGFLRALNGGDGGGAPARGSGAGLQYFHAGGVVRGQKEGGRYPWVELVRSLLGQRGQGNRWSPGLTNDTKDMQGFPGQFNSPTYKVTGKMLKSIRDWMQTTPSVTLKSLTDKFSTWTWGGAQKLIPNELKMYRVYQGNREALTEGVPKTRAANLHASMVQFGRTVTGWIKSAQHAVGMERTGSWSADLNTGLAHLMKHPGSRKIEHDEFAPRPWSPLTEVEEAAKRQREQNKFNQEYNQLLDKLSLWGVPHVIEELLERGAEDGMELARAAVKSKKQTLRWEEELKKAKEIEETSDADSLKFVAFVMGSDGNVGIRDVARHLGVPDYGVVQTMDKLISAGRLPKNAKTARLRREVDLYRRGMFYAATGGAVPGSGSGDTVPAMLEPGEFVIRKKVAKALGMNFLQSLNSPQGFRDGGPVFAPNASTTMPSFSTPASMLAGISGAAQAVNVSMTFDTKIYHPKAETSTAAMHRMLRQKAAIGEIGPAPRSGWGEFQERPSERP